MPDQYLNINQRYDDEMPEKPMVSTRDVIDEALARQAAKRAALEPPKEMPIAPTLPRQPKPARERKRRRPYSG